jgi:hypothetical protein
MHRALLTLTLATTGVLFAQDAKEIIRKSVQVNDADFKFVPQYSNYETDAEQKLNADGSVKSRSTKTFDVLMIEGSPYNKLIAIGGKPLPPEEQKNEEAKLQAEISRRQHESATERKARIAKYERERTKEHMLMHEMINAFDFKLVGRDTVNKQSVYVLEANPKPDYNPPSSEAKVLAGMKGKLWIDARGYHWVKVQAKVIKPVNIDIFIAKVRPGTEFEYDQAPVGGVWLPRHFVQSVNARVLGVHSILSREEETSSNYRQANVQALNRQ